MFTVREKAFLIYFLYIFSVHTTDRKKIKDKPNLIWINSIFRINRMDSLLFFTESI